jgi:anaerobic magnesium-protoporphyrin IX monomethyl ester cyclase
MKITLVQCPPWDFNMPPLGLAYLDAYLSAKGHHISIVDVNLELYNKSNRKNLWEAGHNYNTFWRNKTKVELIFNSSKDYFIKKILKNKPDVVGFSATALNIFSSMFLAGKIKEKCKKIKIVFGGPECSINNAGKELINESFVDAVIIGEGELAFSNLLLFYQGKFKSNQLKGILLKSSDLERINYVDFVSNLNSLPFPNFDSFSLEAYKISGSLPIVMSRGCINNCSYCTEKKFWNHYRFRKAEEVFREITRDVKKYNASVLFFNDSLINGNIDELGKLCDLIIDSGIKVNWNGNAIIRKEMTSDLLRKMHKAGCTHLVYGLENASDKVLRLMGRRYASKVAQKVLRDTRDSGIEVLANWIIGFPGETKKDFFLNIIFLIRNKGVFKVTPVSTFKLLTDNDMINNLKKYDIVLNGIDSTDTWMTKDKKNTFFIRQRRLRIFTFFLKLLKMQQ